MVTSRVYFFIFIGFFTLLISCAPSPHYTPVFRVTRETLDCATLKNRRIVIDPGHGGRFTGAIGIGGLRESDINLTVGLHLWGLLKQAGADVSMTRSADVDLCPPGNIALSEDVIPRSQLSNNFKADLFISIHHNSNTYDRGKNETQIYYKLMDPGASQDLANCVAQELKRGQSLAEVSVLPGNYRVLRNTQALAILGEASFISNKKNEKRLTLANQLRREAEDYFLGILTYFQKGIPEVIDQQPDGVTMENACPQIHARVVGGKGAESIAPETLKLYLDDMCVPAYFDPQTGTLSYCQTTPLKNGWHTYWVYARNQNGNATWVKPVRFCVSLPAAKITVVSAFPALPADGKSYSRIDIEVLDDHGNPVIDGTSLALKISAGRIEKNVVTTTNGQSATCVFAPHNPRKVIIEAKTQGVTGKTTINCGPIDDALVRITITNNNQKPITMAQLRTGKTLLGTSDQEGLVFMRTNHTGKIPIVLHKPGYISQEGIISFENGVFKEKTFILTPKENGLLIGKKIILDPEPWDEKTEKVFGLSADYEEANLLVAQKLQTLLEEAGAITTLTRHSLEEHPTSGDRVITGEKFGGEYFITITHRKGMPYATHYFLSHPGEKLAKNIAQSLDKELRIKKMNVQEGMDFTIIHPSSPSILINFGEKHLSKGAKEKAAAQEARGIYQGLVEFFKGQKS